MKSIVIFLLCSCCVLFVANTGQAQFSPGDLTESHAFLEGMGNCTGCHELGEPPQNDKCLDCHQLINNRMANQQGFHGQSDLRDKLCSACHSEHNGREFDLIHWPDGRDNFNHAITGYALEGKHAQIECRACHKPENIVDPAVLASENVNRERSYLGLNPVCASCHTDQHRGQLGTDCLRCHTYSGWKSPPKFDHEQAKFRLTGKHIDVECEKCHKPVANAEEPYIQYTGLAFETCIGCHQDAHEGKFGANCESCHTTQSWQATVASDFDHSRTRYPLIGKHQQVECEKCHTSGKMTDPLRFENCQDCHVDGHWGQLTDRSDRGRCEACHTVQGFRPVQFSIDDHQKSEFALEGSHLAVPCVLCHLPVNGPVKGKLPQPVPTHLQQKTKTGRLISPIQFEFTNLACLGCHVDIHHGQFAEKVEQDGCQGCHTTESWLKLRGFDHDETRFPLKGKHQNVECAACHQLVDAGLPTERRLFKDVPITCQGCHDDQHQGQFQGESNETDCGRCHNVNGWKENVNFVHNRDSRFKLDGAHEKVPCRACHFVEYTAEQVPFVRYKPLKSECQDCHS